MEILESIEISKPHYFILRRLIPPKTSTKPTICIQPKSSPNRVTAIKIVNTGPMLPVILMRVAPMRLIASLVKKLGIKVENIANKKAKNHNLGETFKSLNSCVAKNWMRIKTKEDDIATLVKIKLPKREISALLKIT